MAGFALVSVSVFVSLVVPGWASGFLAKQLPALEVEQALLGELAASSEGSVGSLQSIETELRPLFTTMPKNGQGRIEPPVVKYALHRYFAQKYGWHVRGLDSAGGSWNASSPSSVMTNRVPSYIQGLFERRLNGEGMGLRDLAVFAATLTNLIHEELRSDVKDIFKMLDLSESRNLSETSAADALRMHSISLIKGVRASEHSLQQFKQAEADLEDRCFIWNDIGLWRDDVVQTVNAMLQPQRNPFVRSTGFREVATVVQEVTQRFASFQNLECRSLKTQLIEMDDKGTGRVPLASFYSGVMDEKWPFIEGTAYLRSLGALDETDVNRPQVIIPNYLSSRSHCVTPSSFYAVCCLNECEGLLSQVEHAIADPIATPAHLVNIISNLPSDTVEAPRNLSSVLLNRLEQIAAYHDGHVPLHGRLFAQWMHHAYPRECRFPHDVGSTVARSAQEWEEEIGDIMDVSDEEALSYLHAAAQLGDTDLPTPTMPWSTREELIAPHTTEKDLPQRETSPARWMALLAAAAAAMWPLVQASKALLGASPEPKRYSI